MSKSFLFTLSFFIYSATFLWAQLPATDVYLFDFEKNEQQIIINKAKLLTASNPDSYNNQPHFIGEKLYITAQVKEAANSKEQTDIYVFNLQSQTQKRISWTGSKSEYSPMLMPDGKHISVVCVEEDETQRIWKIPVSGDGPSNLLLPNLKKVGYYYWIDYEYIVCFIVGEPHSLVLYNTKSRESSMITQKPGRGLQLTPNGNLVYVSKPYGDKWLINEYDFKDASSTPIINTLGNSEDFIMLNDGTIIMGMGPKLYKYKALEDQRWKEIADFSAIGVSKITRIAVNKEQSKIAIVSFKNKK